MSIQTIPLLRSGLNALRLSKDRNFHKNLGFLIRILIDMLIPLRIGKDTDNTFMTVHEETFFPPLRSTDGPRYPFAKPVCLVPCTSVAPVNSRTSEYLTQDSQFVSPDSLSRSTTIPTP